MRLTTINDRTRFKGEFILDIGASTPDASCKMKECDEFGRELNMTKTVVNEAQTGYFESTDHFVKSIGDRVGDFYQNLDGKGLSRLTVLLPGATHSDKCIRTPNLKDSTGTGLIDIDFSTLKAYLLKKGVKINKDCDIKILQDSTGMGLSVFKKMAINELKDKNQKFLEPGTSHTVVMTGGGCGIAQIQVFDKGQVLVQGSGSNFLSEAGKTLRISDMGASVKATLEEFSKYIGIPEKDTKDVVNSGVGELVINEEVTLKKTAANEKLKKVLEKTNKYIIENSAEKISLKIKPEFINDFQFARIESINKYATALARFIPMRLVEGVNNLIVTGPFAFAIDDCLKENYHSSIEKLIHQKFTPYNTDEYKAMMATNQFKIICDKTKFAVSNNTDCSETLRFTRTMGERRNWLMVDLNGFKKFLTKGAQVAKKVVK